MTLEQIKAEAAEELRKFVQTVPGLRHTSHHLGLVGKISELQDIDSGNKLLTRLKKMNELAILEKLGS